VLDGVYLRGIDRAQEFVEVPESTDEALLAVLHEIITRKLKTPWRDGPAGRAWPLMMSPLAFMQRLAPLAFMQRLAPLVARPSCACFACCPRNFALRIERPPAARTKACRPPTPSCARGWRRKGPGRRGRPRSPPSARRTVNTTGRCG
jgi:hypothetical protein